MSAGGYGALSAIVLVAAIGTAAVVERGANYKPADATVFRIDRTCSFTRVYQGGPEKKPSEQVEQDCSATDEFKAIASSAKRQKDVDGKAVVKVSYTAPQDHGYHTGELRFDGHDDQFYALMAGDTVKILVANKNPDKIRLD